VLDCNLKPKLVTFLFESDFEKYQRMTSTIEAIFEALPMLIL
jgi:hypothetical protein